jgi:probable rRNA maturation factor
MKNTNLISSSEKLKLEIIIQNQKLWKDMDNIFCMLVLDLLSKITEDKNELKKSASILLTDDLYMKEINKKWRKLEKATNVLSFPVNKQIKEEDYFFIGDIVLSYETILSECKLRKKSFKDHFLHLLVHGFLHLLGYNHDNKRNEKEMEELEVNYLSELNIKNPYEIRG